jgi:hypothetical protein
VTYRTRRPKARRPSATVEDGPAQQLRVDTMISKSEGSAYERSDANRLKPPTTKAGSTAPSACSDGFDDVDGGPDCGVYTESIEPEQAAAA